MRMCPARAAAAASAASAGFPPDLRELIPGPPARRAGLERSAGGFSGEVQQYGRWYGFGVIPVPTVGEDVTLILFRSEP